MNLQLSHHNDGKQKWQSHEIKVYDVYNISNEHIFSYDLSDICGYGDNEESAINNFKEKFAYYMDEMKTFEKILFETDILKNNIIEVDCFNKKIKEKIK